MDKDKRKNVKQNDNDKRKWYSLVGFLISIVLLSIAIFMSVNQEKNQRLASLSSRNTVEVSTTDINKGIDKTGKMIALSNSGEESTTDNIIAENTPRNIIEEIDANTSAENAQENSSRLSEQNKIQEDDTQENKNQENEEKRESNEQEDQGNDAQENRTQESTNSNNINPNQFIKPVEGEEISNFSMNSLIYSNTLQEWITHRGIDIKAEKGTEVKASKSGKVKLVNTDPRYGVSITIEHNEGFTTVYSCMLDTVNLKEGDSVEQGQTIGHIGNSGVFEVSDGMHLHFEMLKNGDYVNPDIYIK